MLTPMDHDFAPAIRLTLHLKRFNAAIPHIFHHAFRPLFFNGFDAFARLDAIAHARQIVIEAGNASTSYIQRKLRVGYARAARLIDMLEERGVIGPGDGAKPREVIGQNSTENEKSNEEIM